MHVTEPLEKSVIDKTDRVREHTATSVQRDIDERIVVRVRRYAEGADSEEGRAAIAARIDELEREPDVEQLLESNAALLAFSGTVLAGLHHRRWLWLPGIVTAFLLQHAIQGWCPPIAVMRRLGVRTRKEIDIERYALKALRGDFGAGAPGGGNADASARWALEATVR
ncbi:DUF2892 domain-containing protein [Streptomyces chitinivorans]|uniref:DUF2892 domain-containing protein n=1 Tax=Streptomyces chitinivorans TaxID=1257027 RepID=A0ABW7HN91_9ACTN|nr:DUF2892 domain-containing protein [Streptomyces chitinivorans]MDH2410525.1 DUF2892 domain-containing protein [Streptomyces chitinivorans]